tara:strand:+ start:610 stop:816 length:207 start_codon:yes stop_codon:yes gene_type:complete
LEEQVVFLVVGVVEVLEQTPQLVAPAEVGVVVLEELGQLVEHHALLILVVGAVAHQKVGMLVVMVVQG